MRRAFVIAAAALGAAAIAVVVAAILVFGSRPAASLSPPLVKPAVARQPAAPPHNALALAAADGSRVVALAVERGQLTAKVVDPSGLGLSQLRVHFRVDGAVLGAEACGSGCYRAARPAAHPRRVDVVVAGRTIAFAVPARAPGAAALLARIGRRYRQQRSVSFSERLASSSTNFIETAWLFEKPDRASYRIVNGAQAIIVGPRRWDRDSSAERWVRAPQDPRLSAPSPPWSANVSNARLLERTRSRIRIAFVTGPTPVWYVVTVDPGRLLLRDVHMVAPAHFMHDRAFSYGGRTRITPPR
jgi:hypothetical protein